MPTDNSPAVLFAPRESDGKRLVDVMPELNIGAVRNSAWKPLGNKHDLTVPQHWVYRNRDIDDDMASALFRVAAEDVLRKAYKASNDIDLNADMLHALVYGADWPTLAALLWRVAEVKP